VLVNLYLALSPGRENEVIDEITKKAPDVEFDLKEVDGKRQAVRRRSGISGEDHNTIPGGPLDSIVVAAPIPDVSPEFFERFSSCKCSYVVGTPGGINCLMPSWVGVLAGMHRLCPVLYLTPQFTREIRFPRNYVVTNMYWNETMKNIVWHTTLTFMAGRPELPQKAGNWGLVLRLNVANALFCKAWYNDCMNANVLDAEKSDEESRIVQRYVDRNSGDDRSLGRVVAELHALDVDVSAAASNLDAPGTGADGRPIAEVAREEIRTRYREQLYENVLICVICTNALLFKHASNRKYGVDEQGVERLQPRCGYVNSDVSLGDIYGKDDAISLLQALPLRRLTPVYDVVAMICAYSALEPGTDLDGGLGLLLGPADDTMGLGLLSEEQRKLSDHPVLMTLPQAGEGVYGAGPFN
jgi:hypothetical protein